MIDVVTDARCKACNKPIVRIPGRRPREYCNDACRQKHYRQHHQAGQEQATLEQQNIAALQEKLIATANRISQLELQVHVQRSRIGELSQENRALRTQHENEASELELARQEIARLNTFIDQAHDIEEAFSTDTGIHSFKKWLRAHQYHAERLGCKKILDDAYGFPPAGSRGIYTEAMRKAYFGLEDKADVWDAWKDMLKDELFQSYYANRNKS